MLKIAVTGTIAAGKTSVSILLKRRGFAVFNSDQYARLTTHRGNPCCEKILAAFGQDLADENGDIDRAKLAAVVFGNEEARKQLNAITHPFVKEGLLRFFERNSEQPAVFAEVPLLFEAGWQDLFDHILVITCSKETALTRMMEERDYTREQALARYESQIDPEKQISMADQVIYNDGSLEELDHSVNLYIRDLRKEIRHGNQSV